MQSLRCTSCHRANPVVALWCSACGNPLDLEEDDELEAAPTEKRPSVDQVARGVPGPSWAGVRVEPFLGRMVGHYRVDARLGAGAMGVVYRATDVRLARQAALKFLRPDLVRTPRARARLLREARAVSALEHPNIATVYEIGEHEDVPFIAFAYYEGETLRERIARAPLSIEEIEPVLGQLAAGLAAAHAAGVVHRDVKPSNVMLARGGAVKILDFGLAKLNGERERDAEGAGEGAADPLTAAGAVVGTPVYMSPEQLRGEAVDARTDLWAVGIIAFEMLTGSAPPPRSARAPGEGAPGRPAAVDTKKLRMLRRDVPPSLQRIVDDLLRDSPDERLPSAAALLQRLGTSAQQTPPLEGGGSRVAPRRASGGENRVCTVLTAKVALPEPFVAHSDDAPDSLGIADPEAQKEHADACLERLIERVTAAGGVVATRDSGGIAAVFGVPSASDDDADRAVLAALAIHAAARGLPRPPWAREPLRSAVRIGIETGRVYVCPSASRSELDVFGDTVAMAVRLREEAAPGETLIGRAASREVVGHFRLEPVVRRDGPRARPASEEASASDPRGMPTYHRVLGLVSSGAAAPSPDFHGLSTRFVDRAPELQRGMDGLETAWTESKPMFLVLTGARGAGRTRVLAELARRASEADPKVKPASTPSGTVLWASCSPAGAAVSYGVAASLLRARFHIQDDDPAEVVLRKLRRGAAELRSPGREDDPVRPEVERHLPEEEAQEEDAAQAAALAAMLGAAPGEPTLSTSDLGVASEARPSKSRIAASMARLFRSAASRGAVLVACDDVEWCDEPTLALLGELVRRLDDVPLVVACTTTPGAFGALAAQVGGDIEIVRIDVPALARRHIEEMARDRLRCVEGVSDDAIRALVDRAEGSPLTLTEALEYLLDAGILELAAGSSWRLHEDRMRGLVLPTTVQGIVQARLDGLDPESRDVLGVASVIGRTFWEGAVESLRDAVYADPGSSDTTLVGQDRRADAGSVIRARTRGVLARLAERRLVRRRDESSLPGEAELVFAESAIQEVAYATLSVKLRRALHAAAARWLERRALGDAAASLLAVHLHRGGALREAASAFARAGAHAASLGQNDEALRLLERARALQRDASGAAARRSGGDADRRLASWRERTRVEIELGDVFRRLGRLDEAEARYDAARRAILRDERRSGLVTPREEAFLWEGRALGRVALVQKTRGERDRAREHAELAIERLTAGGATYEIPAAWALLAGIHFHARDATACLEAARRGLRACRGRSETEKDRRWQEAVSNLLSVVGAAFHAGGRLVQAERCYRQAARLVDEASQPGALAAALNNAAGARCARGDWAGALPLLLRSLRLKRREGDLYHLAIAHSNVAEVEHELGDHGAAFEHAREAVRLGERARAHADLPDCYRNLARACVARRKHDEALEAATRAVDLAWTTRARVYLGLALVELARSVAAALADDGASDATRDRARGAARALDARLAEAASDPELAADVTACRAILAATAADLGA